MGAVGELIRRYRLRAGMSQSDLAGEDFSASYVSLIESGKRHPSDEALTAFAKRLGCSVDDLRAEPVDDALSAELEISYVRLALSNGEPEAARVRLQALLARGDLGARFRQEALLLLAETHEKTSDLDAAIAVLKPVFDLCLQGRSPLPLAKVAIKMCWYCLTAGDFDAAVRMGEKALRANADAGLGGTTMHLSLQGTVMAAYFELGDEALALAVADDLIRVARQSGSAFGEAAAYWNAAVVAEARGRLHEALHLSQRALGLMGEQDTSRDLTRLEVTAAELILRVDPDRAWYAIDLLDRSLPALEDLGSPAELGAWEAARAVGHLLTGDPRSAERLARRAKVHLQDAGDLREEVRAVITLGDALVAQGRRESGMAAYAEARQLLAGDRSGWQVAQMYRSIAYRLSLAGDAAGAAECQGRALDARGVTARILSADVAFGRREPTPAPAADRDAVADTGAESVSGVRSRSSSPVTVRSVGAGANPVATGANPVATGANPVATGANPVGASANSDGAGAQEPPAGSSPSRSR